MLLDEEGGWQGVGELERKLFVLAGGNLTKVKMAEDSLLGVAGLVSECCKRLAAVTGTRYSNLLCFVSSDLDNW